MCGVHLNLPKRNDFYVSVNGVELYKETISLSQMIAVGDVKTGDTVDIRIECDKDESSTMTVSAAVLNGERFARGYEILSASQLNLTKFRSTLVEGTIDCDRDGLLYTSGSAKRKLERQGGRQACRDQTGRGLHGGRESDEGVHNVRLMYHNAAFSLGWKISLACAAVFGGLAWSVYRPDKKYKK